MFRLVGMSALVLLVATCAGCGGDTESAQSSSSQGGGSAAAPRPDNKKPEQIVFDFLEAVRTGDENTAAAMLTPLARTKTAEYDLVVAPPGSATASFEVQVVETVSEDVRHVSSVWSDVNPDGTTRSDEIVWLLRKEPIGWRIGGMATKLLDYEVPLVLNFEDPEDMIRRQSLAEQEVMKRMEEEAQAAAGNQGQVRQAAEGQQMQKSPLR